MTKKIFQVTVIALVAMTVFSCDKIEAPYTEDTGISAGDTNCPFPTDATPVYRKILLEDYTGHLCGNCPDAAAELYNVVKPLYGDTLIVLAVHAGPLNFTGTCPADNSYPPSPNTLPTDAYSKDYRTPSGNTWFTDFNVSNNPKGLVSRIGTPPTVVAWQNWGTAIQSATGTPAKMKLQILNTYNSSTGELNTCVKTTFLSDTSGATYNLSVVLAEDSIVDWQRHYSGTHPTYGTNLPNYVHQHVMRGTLNTVYGEEIKSGTIATGDTVVKSYKVNLLSLPAAINPINPTLNVDNCHVIAFVFDANTKEILQVEEAEVQ